MKQATQKLVVTQEYGEVHSSDKKLWEKIISDWLTSGMSQRKFCKHHGLNKHTLSYWRSQFLAQSKSSNGKIPTMIPVTITKTKQTQSSDYIRLQTPKGYIFNLPSNLDVSVLSSLLQAIGASHA